MSNRHAARVDEPSFCSTIASYTRMAATSSDRDFVTLAQSVIEPPASSCGAAGYAVPAVAAPPPVRRPETAYADDPYTPALSYPGSINYPVAGYAPPPPEPAYARAEPADAEAPPPYPRFEPGYAATQPAYAEGPPAYAEAAVPPDDRAPPPLLQPVVEEPVVQAAPVARPMPVARTTVIANAPIVAPDEGGGAATAQALQAAITALQAATEALKAQAHPSN